MKLINIITLVMILAFVVAVSGCTNNSSPTGTNNAPINSAPNPNNPAINNNSGATGPTTTQKITDSQYANKAYLISGDTLDAATQTAISGFSIDKIANNDGTTTIKLSSTNPEYTNQSYTLQSGQKLYFIESFLADDGNNEERNLGDDKAIVTDADGNIIQS